MLVRDAAVPPRDSNEDADLSGFIVRNLKAGQPKRGDEIGERQTPKDGPVMMSDTESEGKWSFPLCEE